MPPSKSLDGERDENNLFPLAGLERLGIFSTLSNFESVAGNDSGAIHRGALKRIDDGDVVGSVSAPNPAPDEDIGGLGRAVDKPKGKLFFFCKGKKKCNRKLIFRAMSSCKMGYFFISSAKSKQVIIIQIKRRIGRHV